MPIAFSKYVLINSGVGAGTSVPVRELMGRLFTINPLLPTDSVLEFSDLDSVGDYFGTSSVEYLRAQFYFGFVSKKGRKAQKISFARWTNAAVAPLVYGAPLANIPTTLSTLTAISNGAFQISLGGVNLVLTGLDFSGAGSLAAVAAILQTAVRTGTGSVFTAGTVVYESVRGSFNFTGGATGNSAIIIAAGTAGTDISSIIGWRNGSATILSNGNAIETVTQTLTNSAAISNNFGSFLFLPAFTLDQTVEAATWNNAQNVLYQYMVPVSAANASAWSTALFNLAGTAVTLAPLSTEYPEQAPMMILATTNYQNSRASQNYMFQTFDLTASVTDTNTSNTYDVLRINYYGNTQEAGQILSFYQRGLLMGLPTAPRDMNTYANEQWFKSEAGSQLMQLLLAVTEVAANDTGRAQVLAILQNVINLALTNGTISVGKPLNAEQIAEITDLTDDENAYYQVQNSGYWVDCEPVQVGSEWQMQYLIIYSKDDVIRKIVGTHNLI